MDPHEDLENICASVDHLVSLVQIALEKNAKARADPRMRAIGSLCVSLKNLWEVMAPPGDQHLEVDPNKLNLEDIVKSVERFGCSLQLVADAQRLVLESPPIIETIDDGKRRVNAILSLLDLLPREFDMKGRYLKASRAAEIFAGLFIVFGSFCLLLAAVDERYLKSRRLEKDCGRIQLSLAFAVLFGISSILATVVYRYSVAALGLKKNSRASFRFSALLACCSGAPSAVIGFCIGAATATGPPISSICVTAAAVLLGCMLVLHGTSGFFSFLKFQLLLTSAFGPMLSKETKGPHEVSKPQVDKTHNGILGVATRNSEVV